MTLAERTPDQDTQLHLPDLAISGFRGIESLSIPRLGQVTLFVGENSVGKTTVLEAVQTYAARGRFQVLQELLTRRREVSVGIDDDGDRYREPDWSALFFGRAPSMTTTISIGPTTGRPPLEIRPAPLPEEDAAELEASFPGVYSDSSPGLEVSFHGHKQFFPWYFPQEYLVDRSFLRRRNRSRRLHAEEELPPVTHCERLGPGILGDEGLARYWDQVALTVDEARAVDALNLILGNAVERVAVVGDGPSSIREQRKVVAKLATHDQPVPLKSLGDGAVRLLGVALALANSHDGFLLIDEAENGIHYSVQAKYWRMVLRTAFEHNVQVLATTHSLDCVRGFAVAATENNDIEGVLYRVEQDEDGHYLVDYPEEKLQRAMEQGFEVR